MSRVLYKQTVLGPAWMVIQPVLSSLMFTVVFGGIASLPTDGMPDFLFYMAGNIVWAYFSNALKQCSTVFVDNHSLFGKVYFPRLVMPISVVLSKLINFFVQFALFAVFLVYYAAQPNSPVQPNWQMLAFIPLVLLQTGMLGMGLGSIISSLTTRYRDLTLLVNLGTVCGCTPPPSPIRPPWSWRIIRIWWGFTCSTPSRTLWSTSAPPSWAWKPSAWLTCLCP